MNKQLPTVTANVVRDLLPVYLAGDASQDTQSLVLGYLEEHPELRREAEEAEAWTPSPGMPQIPTDLDRSALTRTKRLLRLRSTLLAFAIFTGLLPFSFGDTGNGPGWLLWPEHKVLVFLFIGVSAAFWIAYFAAHRRLQLRGF